MNNISEQLNKEEIIKYLGDREWRLSNLYFIRDEKGEKIQFRLNDVQKEIHDNLWYQNIVPKARQLGCTTFFTMLYFDQILFSQNKVAAIVAHRQEDMRRIFSDKIKFAFDNLHPWLKEKIGEPNTDSAHELSFANGSKIFVTMSTRSGSVQFLHVSEFGYICQKFPEKADEIVSGALNSVHAGQMVSIESTAAGREGWFYEFCMTAEKARKERKKLTPLDFKIFFFPWHVDPRYVMDADFPITSEFEDYFSMLQGKYGIVLSDGQKRWYMKKKALNKDKMFSEFPSTLEEAFSSSVEGSYYAKEMNRVYLENRIKTLPYDPRYPVETWWDLGMSDDTVILFTQSVGPQIRFVDMYTNRGESLAHYYGVLKDRRDELGYRYGHHNFPHDLDVDELGTGVSRKATLVALGMTDIRIAPKIGILDGIDRVRNLFSKFYFDEEKCSKLHDALFNYRKEFDDKLGTFKDRPRHDKNSHIADAIRVLGVLWRENIPVPKGEEKQYEQSFFGS